MSFRLFIYYCAVIGGWAGFFGWALGRYLAPAGSDLIEAGLKGLFLGLMVAFGLGLVDSLWNIGLRQVGTLMMRLGVAIGVGSVGGFFGGLLGQSLLFINEPTFFIIGWTFTGLLVGASIGAFEFVSSMMKKQDEKQALGKLTKCVTGGTIGGALGGIAAWIIRLTFSGVFDDTKTAEWLWGPTAIGFAALGACIGLLVGLAQVILKEAWVKVEAGFRPGREMIIAKEKVTIGRAEGSDIPLFGDSGVEKAHALIVIDGNRYYLVDSDTPGGTFVNDQKINGRVPLRSGDLIKMGNKSLLRFYEKAKRN